MRHHVVHRGESLSAIAHRYGVNWQELAQVNRIRNPSRIDVGQRLVLPEPPVRAATPAAPAPRPRASAPVGAPRPVRAPHPVSAPRAAGWHPGPAPRAAPQAAPQAAPTPQPAPGGPGTGVAGGVTEAELRAVMPTAGARTARYLAPINTAMRSFGIDTNERRAAFLAQISVESGELHNVEENLNYSAGRLRAVWPRRFRTDQAARTYAHDPAALANHVYADRLGNGDEASGDGYRYRGRGLMQTTGRANYRAIGFENNPEALSDPQTAADSAARFWSSNGLNGRTATVLARSAFNGVSRTVNGGDHGSDERWAAYQRALRALQPAPAP